MASVTRKPIHTFFTQSMQHTKLPPQQTSEASSLSLTWRHFLRLGATVIMCRSRLVRRVDRPKSCFETLEGDGATVCRALHSVRPRSRCQPSKPNMLTLAPPTEADCGSIPHARLFPCRPTGWLPITSPSWLRNRHVSFVWWVCCDARCASCSRRGMRMHTQLHARGLFQAR